MPSAITNPSITGETLLLGMCSELWQGACLPACLFSTTEVLPDCEHHWKNFARIKKKVLASHCNDFVLNFLHMVLVYRGINATVQAVY